MEFNINFARYTDPPTAPSIKSYKYYRLVMTFNGLNTTENFFQIVQLKLIDLFTGNDIAVNGLAVASDFYKEYDGDTRYTADKAFDNDDGTSWQSYAPAHD